MGNSTAALFVVDGVVYALEAWCLQCGTPLERGVCEGLIVACQGCAWRYHVITGAVLGIPALRLQTFDVEFIGGKFIIASG